MPINKVKSHFAQADGQGSVCVCIRLFFTDFLDC